MNDHSVAQLGSLNVLIRRFNSGFYRRKCGVEGGGAILNSIGLHSVHMRCIRVKELAVIIRNMIAA